MVTTSASHPDVADQFKLKLTINEIFFSLQGETGSVGIPTVFIRLTGCPLRCQYCDTEYAFHAGRKMSIKTILDEVRQYNTNYITVTGGEPLAQKSCPVLLSTLCAAGYRVSLETSGAMDISGIDTHVIRILDLKTPGSKEENKNRYENLDHLQADDEIKFVICDRNDYEWAKDQLRSRKLDQICSVLFSPCYGQLSATELADWILADQLPVRLQIQLHKTLWGDVKGK
ncbi:MAG: 7-carboxy-7-deazaguanine synthase QueE [Thiotrichales bacterium]|nr:7-carboxy-7-deazaguanine synthase QueE [Thiotrichales bacterium]